MTSENTEMACSLEEMARMLDSSGTYRVFRKLDIESMLEIDDGSPTRVGVFIDVETTGLDQATDEIIEIALLPFKYSLDGRIFSVEPPIHQLNEPSINLPLEITAITGLTNEVLKGRRLDLEKIEDCVRYASIVVAHNAEFDRPFVEKLSSVFAEKPWGCSMNDIPWREEGIEGRRLSDILSSFRFYFDPHRAFEDCSAGIGLLTLTLPKTGRRALDRLLENAREPKWRIFAVGAPFNLKDFLKRRGYRWNSDQTFGPRAWWVDRNKEDVDAEVSLLRADVLGSGVDIPVLEVNARNRYSLRLS